MRHNIKLFAACIMGAAMLLSSCEERIGGEGNIFFTADVASYKGVGTKAAAIGNPDNDTDTYVPMFTDKYGTAGFTVSAYKGTTARFTNAISFYANQKWSLDQTAKWYSGETLDFYAFAPAGAAFASNQSVNPSINAIRRSAAGLYGRILFRIGRGRRCRGTRSPYDFLSSSGRSTLQSRRYSRV